MTDKLSVCDAIRQMKVNKLQQNVFIDVVCVFKLLSHTWDCCPQIAPHKAGIIEKKTTKKKLWGGVTFFILRHDTQKSKEKK